MDPTNATSEDRADWTVADASWTSDARIVPDNIPHASKKDVPRTTRRWRRHRALKRRQRQPKGAWTISTIRVVNIQGVHGRPGRDRYSANGRKDEADGPKDISGIYYEQGSARIAAGDMDL